MDGVAPCELVATLKSNGLDYRVEVGSDQQGPVLTDSLFTDVWNVLREHGNSQKTKISLYFDFEGHSPVSINPSIERIRKAGIEFAETCVRLLTHESFANMWWDGLVSAICSAVVDACQDIANDDLYELGESRRYLCAGSAGTGHSAQSAKPLMSWLMLNDLPAGVSVGPPPVWPSGR